MASNDDPLVGRTLGDFLLRERFAAGGGGDVYLAEQVTLGRQAVVKIVHQEGNAPQRFLREARLASRLDHPFAAHVYGFGAEEDGTLWMAMELVRGTPLDVIIKDDGPIPIDRFVPFFERLCEVLHAAHEQGIVHRDIKPQNVMVLTRAGSLLPKLLDLGISRRIGKDDDADLPIAPPRPLSATGDDTDTQVSAPAATSRRKAAKPVKPAKSTAASKRSFSLTSKTSRTAKRLAESETLDITREGEVVGTPHYIAPERWTQKTRADVRADLYSLAIVAYEALTGRLPYADVKSLPKLAEAQATRPLPPLPDALPAALYDVLARGAAADPEARYDSALALAAAVRAACRLGSEPASLRGLPADLVDNFTHEAPQPIAEAVARIEAARTERQQAEAIELTARIVTRWLALCALAASARVGSPPSAAASKLLQTLATGTLEDRQWYELGVELTRPFVARPRTHPLPELVAALALPLLEHPTLDTLAARLRQLVFLLDYPLVVDGESWMGARRAERLPHAGRGLPLRQPVLLDGDGQLALSLHPFVQVFAPAGGMRDELFLLAGNGRHGARLVAYPGPFELESDQPWAFVSAHLCDVDATTRAIVAEKPPYKGLATFGREDADNYFGREREAQAFANRLRANRFLAVVGPSGTGKSSFVLAGVLPLLPDATEVIVMRPGAHPKVPALVGGERPRLVVVDQFEELLTLCADGATRERFAAELCALAVGETRVVITLRDDFLIKVQQLAAMRERLSRSLQLLGTPAKDDLLRVLTEPARRAGHTFDDPDLPARMIETVADHPGALALLSFAASQLWALRDRGTRMMRKKVYDAIGGVGGALGQHAEETLASMTEAERPLVREAFRHLVTAERTRAVLSRREMLELLGPGAAPVMARLVDARLLVTSADEQDRIEIIHEALIESWPRLVEWLREDAEVARLRDALRASARQWHERGRPRGLLWREESLAEYKVWRARYPGRLTRDEEDFAAASLADEARGRLIRRALAVTAFAGLSTALVLIFGAYREAKQRFLALRQEQARLALLDTQPLKALAYLRDAVRNGADNPSLRRMASLVAYELGGARGVVARHKNAVWKTALSHDGKIFASLTDDVDTALSNGFVVPTQVVCNEGTFTAKDTYLVLGCLDGALRLVDPRRGVIEKTIPLGDQPLWDVTARSDDAVVLATQPRFGARQVNLRTGQITDVWRDAEAPPVRTDVDPVDKHIAVFSGSGTIDVKSLRGLWLFPEKVHLFPDVVVHDAGFSHDSRRLVIGTDDGQVAVYDLLTHKLRWQKALRDRIISHAQFSPDGKWVLANDAETTLYDAETGKVAWSVPPGGGSLCWAPDSKRMFNGGGAGVLEARDFQTGDIVWRHVGHGGVITHCRVTPDGETVITTSESGTVRLWDARRRFDRLAADVPKIRNLPGSRGPGPTAVITAKGLYLIDEELRGRPLFAETVADSAVTTVDMADDGSIAYSVEDRLRVVDAAGPRIVSEAKLPGPIIAMAMSTRGSRIASFLLSAGAVFATTREGTIIQKLVAEDHVDIAGLLFIDEKTLVTCNLNGDLRVWNVDDGKLLETKKGHSGQCGLERAGLDFRTMSEDRSVVRWRWTGKLEELDRRVFPRTPRAFRPGRDLDVVTESGHFALYDDRALPLGELRIRGADMPAASLRGDRFIYWDRAGVFSELAPPPPVELTALDELDRCRGLWELTADHIAERAAEPDCR